MIFIKHHIQVGHFFFLRGRLQETRGETGFHPPNMGGHFRVANYLGPKEEDVLMLDLP